MAGFLHKAKRRDAYLKERNMRHKKNKKEIPPTKKMLIRETAPKSEKFKRELDKFKESPKPGKPEVEAKSDTQRSPGMGEPCPGPEILKTKGPAEKVACEYVSPSAPLGESPKP